MTKAEFRLETLTCPACVSKIDTAVSNLEGVQSVKVLFNSSKVKVEFDNTKIDAEKIENTIKKLGYPVLSSKVS
ncbi:MAG TPA: heavy-metal-associated domain-containing protein [Clostridiales bacterium]|nr:heavy-metal-associated domain-containing protein [Clostridiales bacterium]